MARALAWQARGHGFEPRRIHKKGEVSEWLKEHAWKACIRLKRIGGSNPPLSAKQIKTSGSSSVGRASAFQAEGREFESRLPLKQNASIAQWSEQDAYIVKVVGSSPAVGTKKEKKMKDKNMTKLVLQGSFESTKDRMLKDSYAQASLFGSLKKFLKKKNKSGDSDIIHSVLSSSDNVN
jgi:hypothetical protein